MATDPLYARFGRDFPEGHVLFREGEAGAVMYVVQRGRVRIARQLPSGERTLAVLGPGEFFGEMAILNHKPRTATATALEPVQALEIGARTLEAMVMSNPELAVRLITKLARRLDSANAVVEILSHRDPRVRVVLGLARAADATGEATAAGLRVPMGADEFAASVGLDRTTVEEVLLRLARVRVVRPADGGGWIVPDVQRLYEFAELLEPRRAAGAMSEAPPGAREES